MSFKITHPLRLPIASNKRFLTITRKNFKKAYAYRLLMDMSRNRMNSTYITSISATWVSGQSALPRWMGLSSGMFREMLDFHFQASVRVIFVNSKFVLTNSSRDEIDDLRRLLLKHRARRSRSERWIAELISVACFGRNHLWSDLGLVARSQLSELINFNFPRLAAQNSKNMRWKKFLFKKLCEGEGLYICRAPTCEECHERSSCFAVDVNKKVMFNKYEF